MESIPIDCLCNCSINRTGFGNETKINKKIFMKIIIETLRYHLLLINLIRFDILKYT